jgi:hypothetical protein
MKVIAHDAYHAREHVFQRKIQFRPFPLAARPSRAYDGRFYAVDQFALETRIAAFSFTVIWSMRRTA